MFKFYFNTRLAILLLIAVFITHQAYAEEILILAVHPYLSTTELEKKFIPFANYLSHKSGLNIKVKIGSDYEEHIQYIGSNRVDIAYMGPASYIKLVNEFGNKPLLAKLEVNDLSYFQGNIIVRKDSSISTLKDLKGKQIALGDINSTMSYIVPHYQLHRAKVFTDSMQKHDLLATHDDISIAVLAGDFDAGAVKPEVFKRYEKEGLRVLAKTPKISEHLFVTRSNLPEKQIKLIQDIMLAMKNSYEGLNILAGIKNNITGLVTVEDRDYENLRKIILETEQLHTKIKP